MSEEHDKNLESYEPIFSRMHPLASLQAEVKFAASANPEERKQLAEQHDLQKLYNFKIKGTIIPDGENFKLQATFRAKYEQLCSVTLEPIETILEEEINRRWISAATPTQSIDIDIEAEDPPETIVDQIDLGDIALEVFYLLLDPYPRLKNLPEPESIEDDEKEKPFAALAALKQKMQSE